MKADVQNWNFVLALNEERFNVGIMWNALLSLYQRYAAQRMFRRWAVSYDADVAENAYSAPDMVAQAAIKYMAAAELQNPRIADIGIGTGLLAQQIYDALPCRITGLDFTDDMMAQCAARDITELLIKCDAGRDIWPIENGSQDAVVAAGLFEYLTPDMVQHFLNESARVLHKNGLLVFAYLPATDGAKKINLWPGKTGTYLTCSYSEDDMKSALSKHGFALLEHSAPFKGSVFKDKTSYDYRLIAARKI